MITALGTIVLLVVLVQKICPVCTKEENLLNGSSSKLNGTVVLTVCSSLLVTSALLVCVNCFRRKREESEDNAASHEGRLHNGAAGNKNSNNHVQTSTDADFNREPSPDGSEHEAQKHNTENAGTTKNKEPIFNDNNHGNSGASRAFASTKTSTKSGNKSRSWDHNLEKSGARDSVDDSLHSLLDTDIVTTKLRSHDTFGLGFNIFGNMSEGIFVREVLGRGPAIESGCIQEGDRLLSITISMKHMVLEDALTILSYASPYTVKLCLGKSNTPDVSRRVSLQTVRGDGTSEMGGSGNQMIHPLYRSQSVSCLNTLSRRTNLARTRSELHGNKRDESVQEQSQLCRWDAYNDILGEANLSYREPLSPIMSTNLDLDDQSTASFYTSMEDSGEVEQHNSQSSRTRSGFLTFRQVSVETIEVFEDDDDDVFGIQHHRQLYLEGQGIQDSVSVHRPSQESQIVSTSKKNSLSNANREEGLIVIPNDLNSDSGSIERIRVCDTVSLANETIESNVEIDSRPETSRRNSRSIDDDISITIDEAIEVTKPFSSPGMGHKDSNQSDTDCIIHERFFCPDMSVSLEQNNRDGNDERQEPNTGGINDREQIIPKTDVVNNTGSSESPGVVGMLLKFLGFGSNDEYVEEKSESPSRNVDGQYESHSLYVERETESFPGNVEGELECPPCNGGELECLPLNVEKEMRSPLWDAEEELENPTRNVEGQSKNPYWNVEGESESSSRNVEVESKNLSLSVQRESESISQNVKGESEFSSMIVEQKSESLSLNFEDESVGLSQNVEGETKTNPLTVGGNVITLDHSHETLDESLHEYSQMVNFQIASRTDLEENIDSDPRHHHSDRANIIIPQNAATQIIPENHEPCMGIYESRGLSNQTGAGNHNNCTNTDSVAAKIHQNVPMSNFADKTESTVSKSSKRSIISNRSIDGGFDADTVSHRPRYHSSNAAFDFQTVEDDIRLTTRIKNFFSLRSNKKTTRSNARVRAIESLKQDVCGNENSFQVVFNEETEERGIDIGGLEENLGTRSRKHVEKYHLNYSDSNNNLDTDFEVLPGSMMERSQQVECGIRQTSVQSKLIDSSICTDEAVLASYSTTYHQEPLDETSQTDLCNSKHLSVSIMSESFHPSQGEQRADSITYRNESLEVSSPNKLKEANGQMRSDEVNVSKENDNIEDQNKPCNQGESYLTEGQSGALEVIDRTESHTRFDKTELQAANFESLPHNKDVESLDPDQRNSQSVEDQGESHDVHDRSTLHTSPKDGQQMPTNSQVAIEDVSQSVLPHSISEKSPSNNDPAVAKNCDKLNLTVGGWIQNDDCESSEDENNEDNTLLSLALTEIVINDNNDILETSEKNIVGYTLKKENRSVQDRSGDSSTNESCGVPHESGGSEDTASACEPSPLLEIDHEAQRCHSRTQICMLPLNILPFDSENVVDRNGYAEEDKSNDGNISAEKELPSFVNSIVDESDGVLQNRDSEKLSPALETGNAEFSRMPSGQLDFQSDGMTLYLSERKSHSQNNIQLDSSPTTPEIYKSKVEILLHQPQTPDIDRDKQFQRTAKSREIVCLQTHDINGLDNGISTSRNNLNSSRNVVYGQNFQTNETPFHKTGENCCVVEPSMPEDYNAVSVSSGNTTLTEKRQQGERKNIHDAKKSKWDNFFHVLKTAIVWDDSTEI